MITGKKRLVLALLLPLLLLACAPSARQPGPGTVYSDIERELATPEPVSPEGAPPPVATSLAPPFDPGSPSPGPERFDIDVQGVEAQTFFMNLVRGSSQNMVVHPGVSGSISLNLRDVTLREVLDTVRDVYGYDFRQTSAGWQIYPATLQSRMFRIDYLDVSRDGRSDSRVSSGTLTEDGGAGSSGSQITTTSQADFWRDLESSLQMIVGTDRGREDGSQARQVIVNSKSGLVMVRALPGELREVETFLDALLENALRQVMLEAKIIEVELDEAFQSGINWGQLATSGSGEWQFGQIGGGTVLDDGVSAIAGNTGNIGVDNFDPIDGTATSAFGGVFTMAADRSNFHAFIELLKTQGDVHVLSSPRVATTNNQKALIKVGNDEYFVTDVSFSTRTTGTDDTIYPDLELTPFFSGIALDVTPTITDGNEVILHIRPSVSQVRDQTKSFTVAGQTQSLPLALSRMRESDSIVRARSGQVIIIGGLMEDSWREQRAGLPGLGDLPLVGNLFRQQRWSQRKTELVILLRPVVVTNERDWNTMIRETGDRVRDFYPAPPQR